MGKVDTLHLIKLAAFNKMPFWRAETQICVDEILLKLWIIRIYLSKVPVDVEAIFWEKFDPEWSFFSLMSWKFYALVSCSPIETTLTGGLIDLDRLEINEKNR